MLVGVISDTHGRLDPIVLKVFAAVGHILHAGDVGSAGILTRLGELAPVTAVRGNTDMAAWAWDLPEDAEVNIEGVRLLISHEEARLLNRHDPAGEGFAAVVTGHSHRAKMEWREGVLHLNPGAAGPKRFGLPRSVALLDIGPKGLRPEIFPLE